MLKWKIVLLCIRKWIRVVSPLLNPNGLMFSFFWAASLITGFRASKESPPFLLLKKWVIFFLGDWLILLESSELFEFPYIYLCRLQAWIWGKPCEELWAQHMALLISTPPSLSCCQWHGMRERGKHNGVLDWWQGTELALLLSHIYIYVI